jgi:cephalosporin hydroxylase
MDPVAQFKAVCHEEITALGRDEHARRLTRDWVVATQGLHYSYHFTAFGRPIIQFPQDMVAVQELIWNIRPTVIVETGIAHGGSLVLSAGMLALLDYADAVEQGGVLDVHASRRRVIGVDIDVRAHNRAALDAHPLRHKIHMIEGSSIDPSIVASVRDEISADDTVLVFLDSNHTHDHVLAELEAYAPLVSRGSYCVVFDTIIEDLPPGSFPHRDWDVGNNPQTAVREYFNRLGKQPCIGLDGHRLQFEVDEALEGKLLITVAPGGYLRRCIS